MLRRHVIGLGSLLLGALSFGGWTLSRKGKEPLLLSARDDADGKHYAVGYRLDGQCAFATEVGLRCHAIVQHPSLPLALFVARRPGRQSYLVSLEDGRLLQKGRKAILVSKVPLAAVEASSDARTKEGTPA